MANVITQNIRIDLNTGKVIPTAFVHQNDTARSLVFELYLNGVSFDVSSYTVKFAYVSPTVNGQHIVIAGNSMATGSVSGNKVTVTLPVAYTRISGVGLLTMIITPSSGTIRPINIRLVVQKSADGDDVVASASDFPSSMEQFVAEWCEENVTPIIDPTLSRTGYVAEAKATGDALNNFYSSVLASEEITIEVPYYTDLVATSKSASNASASTFGTNGLQSGYTIKGDGSLLEANAVVTGYIPFTMGDTIRIKQKDNTTFDTSTMIVLFNDGESTHSNAGKTVENILGNSAYGTASVSGNVFTWDTSTASYYTWSQMTPKWFRFASSSSDPVATVNEEIQEGTRTIVTTQPILNPTVQVKEENLGDIEFASNPLANKKVLCVGDSLFGLYHDSTGTPAYVAEFLDCTVYNCGFGGCRMAVHPSTGYAAFSMFKLADAIASGSWTQQNNEAASGENYFSSHLDRLKAIDFSSLDYMVIHYGTNDFNANVPLDNSNNEKDTTTVLGALRYSIDKILTKYPNIMIFVSVPIYRMWNTVGAETYTNSLGNTLVEYVDGIAQAASELGCPVIDGYHDLSMNRYNFATFASDKTHLTSATGRKRFGYLIGGTIYAKG